MRRGMVVKKQFPDLKHGGTDAALAKAIEFRDQVLMEMPPYTYQEQRAILRASNSSGIPGVHHIISDSGRETWCARIRLPNGANRTKSFSVKKHGAAAKELAIQFRRAMLAEIDGHFLLGDAAREATHAVLPPVNTQSPNPELTRASKPQEICEDYKIYPPSGQPGVVRARAAKRDPAGNITSEQTYWHASYRAGGIRKSCYFRIKPGMEEDAFRQAMAQRAAWEAEFGPAKKPRTQR